MTSRHNFLRLHIKTFSLSAPNILSCLNAPQLETFANNHPFPNKFLLGEASFIVSSSLALPRGC